MKKLNKLQINSEKLMKNEELITLRGGYDSGKCCECHVLMSGETYYATNSSPIYTIPLILMIFMGIC